ncbi:MAG: GbsR/MarR family transcriptional regulator [Solirubrobacteraceae bacterium]
MRFIERFAALLSEAGIPRMPARVFVTLLTSDTGRLTAAELADRLQVSPAAISGAVRYLIQVNLAGREREPGSRRDLYGVHGDIWYEAVLRREHFLARGQAGLRDGIELLGAGTPAGDRLTETLAFFDFVQAEMPPMLERWRARKRELRAGDANEPAGSRPPRRS